MLTKRNTVIRVHFADAGQDFLEWRIDGNGIVRESHPAQASQWAGSVVINPQSLKRGMRLQYICPHDFKLYSIKYPIRSIQRRK